MSTTLRILIIDDERPARRRLLDLLANAEDIQVIGEAASGPEAITAIRSLGPDLVFLDVQMPGMTGVDVVRTIGPKNMPAVIFVTAYNQHAVQAFEVAALDYLLKPFDDERFMQALDRARRAIRLQSVDTLRAQLARLMRTNDLMDLEPKPPVRYLERIGVSLRGQMRIIPVNQIDFITASGSYAELHVGEEAFLIREQMQTLQDRLDPHAFFRIHRGTIVQLDRIDRLLYSSGGDYTARLHNGKKLKVSRAKWDELSIALGVS